MLSGELILPPFFDDHTHCREPGNNPSETIASATEAAAEGGVGGINDMSNNAPQPTSTLKAQTDKLDIARKTSVVAYGAAMGVQPEYDNVGQIAGMLSGALLVKIYGGPTTNINRTTDYEASEFGESLDEIARVDPDKLVVLHSGESNYWDFIGHAAGDRGLRVQLTHVNKMDQVRAVKKAQARGWDVEASICPHTMLLTERDRLTRSSFADMQPSLVHQDDAEELFDAFVKGDIRGLATDHAPHPKGNKMDAIRANPACLSAEHGTRCCGVPGLELASKVMLWQVHIGRLPLSRLVDSYSTYPSQNLRVGFAANSQVVWDMKAYRIDNEAKQVKSLSGYTPFLGMMAMGVVQEMTLSGRVVYREGKVVGPARKVISGKHEEI